jgi:myosin heavy subunit
MQYRTLEQENDDLERSSREGTSAHRDLEQRVANLVEKNTVLEHEAEQKAKLVVVIQRLKDELQDAQLEIGVLRKKQHDQATKKRDLRKVLEKSHQDMVEQKRASISMSSSASTVSNEEEEEPQPVKAAVVNDPVRAVRHMLNRVKVLESRLVNCRSLVNPLLEPPPTYEAAMGTTRRKESGVVLDKALAEQLVEERLKLRLQLRKERAANSGSESASSEPTSRRVRAQTMRYNSSLAPGHSAGRKSRTGGDY